MGDESFWSKSDFNYFQWIFVELSINILLRRITTYIRLRFIFFLGRTTEVYHLRLGWNLNGRELLFVPGVVNGRRAVRFRSFRKDVSGRY